MCGLYVVRKGHSHEAVYDFVEETETGLPVIVSN